MDKKFKLKFRVGFFIFENGYCYPIFVTNKSSARNKKKSEHFGGWLTRWKKLDIPARKKYLILN